MKKSARQANHSFKQAPAHKQNSLTDYYKLGGEGTFKKTHQHHESQPLMTQGNRPHSSSMKNIQSFSHYNHQSSQQRSQNSQNRRVSTKERTIQVFNGGVGQSAVGNQEKYSIKKLPNNIDSQFVRE